MQQIPVPITVQLASAAIGFEEIISLQVDDILLLDKKVDEPVELIVEGKRFLRGRPAKSAGRYAVVITELCDAK
jgi:flagellar motor switch/type III secretory pathway protein FliN